MRVLLICDDHYHPGDVPVNGTLPLKEKGFDIVVQFEAAKLDLKTLQQYPVIILSKSDKVTLEENSNWKRGEIQQAFIEYVEKGGGLVVTHSGTVGGKESDPLDQLIGCRFKYHPKACSVFIQPLKPHPVTNGITAFRETDEHYRIEILQNDIDVLAASYSPRQDEEETGDDPFKKAGDWIGPACYVRTRASGRICVLTPGHNLAVWHNTNFQKMLENALNWCAGKNH